MSKYQTLLAEFPSQAMMIRRAILSDSDFAAVCDDYLSCAAAIDHWAVMPDSAKRVDEYRRLLSEIRTEITEYLRRHGVANGTAPAANRLEASQIPPANMEKN